MNLIAKVEENEGAIARPFQVLFKLDGRLFASIAYQEDSVLLEKLVFNIARKPRHLLSHVQRIVICYENSWSAPLLAALIDFLIVLNGRGKAIAQRLLFGTKSRLTEGDLRLLKNFLADGAAAMRSNALHYSIFSRGLEGAGHLVEHARHAQAPDYDPLDLARDHIEYSQLDDAKRVLEQAVSEDPNRVELQEELLGLYWSTRDHDGFMAMFYLMHQAGYGMIEGWDRLYNLFKGQEQNG